MEVNSGENDHSMRVAGQEEEDDDELLERRILGHPLYLLLVETHINCVKVGLGEIRDVDRAIGKKQVKFKHGTPNYPGTSELDLFMEAYCISLNKLREAMEEPLQETASFIKEMYKQLREINENHSKNPKSNSSN